MHADVPATALGSDARDRVSGRTEYPSTVDRPGMLHARLLRSAVPHGRIRRLDASRAAALPGVHAVLTGETLRAIAGIETHYGPVLRDQPIVAMDVVRFVGEPVAAVAAEDLDTLDRALALIDVEYDELPSVFDGPGAFADGAPLVHETLASTSMAFAEIPIDQVASSNICHHYRLRTGDADRGLAGADFVFDDTFTSPVVQHVPLETHACVAEARPGHVTVWTGTQIPHGLRRTIAEIFHLPVTGVRIIVPTLGGGYGGKGHPTIEPVAAVLSLLTRRPVRIQLSREEEFVTITKHAASVRIVTGVSRDGMLLARRAECIFNTGAYADVGPRVAKNGGYGMAGPYRIPDISVDSYAVYTNLPPAGAFRAFGVPQGAWAYESQMDIIADRLGIDPVAIRRKNLLRDGEELSTGQLMEDSHFEELLDLVAPAVREDGVRAAEQRGRRTCRGTGFATIVKGTVTPSTSTAIVKLNQDGSADVLTSAVEMGQGFKKTMALIVGRELGISAGRVSVSDPDTDVTPYDQQTSSSRSTYATGSAVRQAAVKIRSQLLADASEQLEVAEADLELSDGRVAVVGTPSSGATIAEVMARSRRGNLIGDGMYRSEGGLDPSTGRGIASVHWHQAAGAADVEVDLDTGKISLLGFRTSVFAGQVINQVGAELQTEGNLAFGLGQALFEELLFDGGQVQNGNLGDYMVASILDMPPSMDVTFLEDPSGNVIHGLGETSLPTIMPAIANAVFAATGARVRELPITPERLLRALAAQPERGSAAVGTSA